MLFFNTKRFVNYVSHFLKFAVKLNVFVNFSLNIRMYLFTMRELFIDCLSHILVGTRIVLYEPEKSIQIQRQYGVPSFSAVSSKTWEIAEKQQLLLFSSVTRISAVSIILRGEIMGSADSNMRAIWGLVASLHSVHKRYFISNLDLKNKY